ncbi:hypothetical protein K504DRAFT_460656, partial [Pleomassaria siparia CBS 279.74]
MSAWTKALFPHPLMIATKGEGPVGWDFVDLWAWDSIADNWFFIPWRNTNTTDIELGVVIENEPATDYPALSDDNKLLIHDEKLLVSYNLRGSGIVVQVDEDAIKAIGCYKTHELAFPSEHTELQLEAQEHRSSMEKEALRISKLSAGDIKKARRHERKRANYALKKRHTDGLIADERPRAFARHERQGKHVAAFRLHADATVADVQKAGRTYRMWHANFAYLLGPAFKKRQDTPPCLMGEKENWVELGCREKGEERND